TPRTRAGPGSVGRSGTSARWMTTRPGSDRPIRPADSLRRRPEPNDLERTSMARGPEGPAGEIARGRGEGAVLTVPVPVGGGAQPPVGGRDEHGPVPDRDRLVAGPDGPEPGPLPGPEMHRSPGDRPAHRVGDLSFQGYSDRLREMEDHRLARDGRARAGA